MKVQYFTLVIILVMPLLSIQAQEINQLSGVDQNVNYESLKEIGPWDDRNFQLTQADLALLSENEQDQSEAIPAFYKVELRRNHPELLRTGPVQYPRSALPKFLIKYDGYKVGENYYRGYEKIKGSYEIDMDDERSIVRPERNRKMSTSEVRVSTPVGAAESAIKIHPIDPNIVIAGSNGPGAGQKMHYSHDGGSSWTEVLLPLGGTCCDPTIDYSSDGAFAYTSTLGNGVYIYRSNDDGVSWTSLEDETPGDPRREIGVGSSDKEYLHVDKHCTSPYQDNVYITWHEGNVMQFSRSLDFGNTWEAKTSFSNDPRGIGSDIVTDADGTIYYFYPAFAPRDILLKRSTDGGATFEDGTIKVADTNGSFDFPIPTMDRREVFIYVAAEADLTDGPYGGSIYAAWTDSTMPTVGNPNNNHARIQVAYSRDQGDTWTVVTPHETSDANSVDRFHQWMAVAVDGSVHLVYYDTRNGDRTSVDFYHSFSTPSRLTSETSEKIIGGFEWGDYNGMDHIVRQSTVFTDNRREGGETGDSDDIYSTTELIGGINITMAPDKPARIFGPSTVCPGQNAPFSAATAMGASSYDWTFSDGSVTINNDGQRLISLDGLTTSGTLTVTASNVCGTSVQETFNLQVASPAACSLADCLLTNLSIDDPTISMTDIFDIIENIDSDASVLSGDTKIFRAGDGIEFTEGFTVERQALFIAQIDDCTAN